MIYGFFLDTALINPTWTAYDIATANIPCGFLTPEAMEYFVRQYKIKDERSNRLPITYREVEDIDINIQDYLEAMVNANQDLIIDNENTSDDSIIQFISLDGFIIDDEFISLEKLNDNLPSGSKSILDNQANFMFDDSKSPEDVELFNNLSTYQKKFIFNIMEYCFYGLIPSDTEASINEYLINNPGNFFNYVPNSFKISGYWSVVRIYNDINIYRLVPTWFQFSYKIDDENQLTFKIWINKSKFEDEYPLFTITKIVPPISLESLLNINRISNIYEAIQDSSNTNLEYLTKKIKEDGHSGYIGFSTRYVHNVATGEYVTVTFNILYKGAQPDNYSIRIAIRNYLLDTGLAEYEEWKAILPDIFLSDRFYLLPIWDNTYDFITRIIYPSVITGSKIRNTTDKFKTLLNEIVLSDTEELINTSYNPMFINVLGDSINENGKLLQEIHPTYQRYEPTNENFVYMEEETQNFTTTLAHVIAIAAGEINDETYNKITLDGFEFVTFINKGSEYLILTKDSYYNKQLHIE
jgi:hypothetical protein